MLPDTIHFLTRDQVLRLHRTALERWPGGANEGSALLDMGLLESAVEMPRAGCEEFYFHKDLFEMAAAYAFYLSKNHPFEHGNKRVAGLAAVVLLSRHHAAGECSVYV